MSAAARGALELVAPNTDTGEPWEDTRQATRWQPEQQYIGALMWLGAEAAQTLLELVPDTAIWDPVARWTHELIRAVSADGDTPNPVLILAAGRRRPPGDALHPDRAPSAEQVKHLSLFLFDAYSHAITPQTAADSYAREVLDEAYRRAFAGCGARMQDLAESGAGRESLTAAFTEMRDELADLWKRATATDRGRR
jgi:hypothetical protein